MPIKGVCKPTSGLNQKKSNDQVKFAAINFRIKIRGMVDFSDQFRKIVMRYKRIGYNLNVMRQSACLVINQIKVDGYAALFNCTPVDRASDSMMARPKAIHFSWLG